MAVKTRNRTDPPGPYLIEFDEALLAEAVAAVEAHRPRRESSTPVPPTVDIDVEIPEPPTVLPRDHGAVPPEEEEDSTSEPGINMATMAAEWARMNAELDRLKVELVKARAERDAAVQRADNESKERIRIAARVKRMSDQAQESLIAASAAREAHRTAEANAKLAQEAVSRSEDATGRMKERLRRQEEETRLYGHTPTVIELLPVLENLERATHTRDSSLATLRDGVKIVHDQFRSALARVGVTRIEANRGMLFQPALHEAVIHVAVSDALPGTVVAELQPGYMLNGRLLRPARVSVAAATGAGAYEAPPPVAPSRPSLSEGDALALPDDGSFEVSEGDDSDEDVSANV